MRTKMDKSIFTLAGKLFSKSYQTDEELDILLDVIPSVLDFLEARGKYQDIVFDLMYDLDILKAMKQNRENRKRRNDYGT